MNKHDVGEVAVKILLDMKLGEFVIVLFQFISEVKMSNFGIIANKCSYDVNIPRVLRTCNFFHFLELCGYLGMQSQMCVNIFL